MRIKEKVLSEDKTYLPLGFGPAKAKAKARFFEHLSWYSFMFLVMRPFNLLAAASAAAETTDVAVAVVSAT
jgi:hypothetical protein